MVINLPCIIIFYFSDGQMYTASQYEFWSSPDIRRNSPNPMLRTEEAPTRWLYGQCITAYGKHICSTVIISVFIDWYFPVYWLSMDLYSDVFHKSPQWRLRSFSPWWTRHINREMFGPVQRLILWSLHWWRRVWIALSEMTIKSISSSRRRVRNTVCIPAMARWPAWLVCVRYDIIHSCCWHKFIICSPMTKVWYKVLKTFDL